MISEGSCDTEDWSNGCWKFSFVITGINYILKYIKIETSYVNIYFQYVNTNTSQYCFYFIFDQINAALVSIKDFIQKPYKSDRHHWIYSI